MREKLKTFTDFTSSLLPHELFYLERNHKFQDQDKVTILEQIKWNVCQPLQFREYNENIDKRKYSKLKRWILHKLKQIDVDQQFNWIVEMERKIMMDVIRPEQERHLLNTLRHAKQSDYYFLKLYELAEQFRQYLLIRMRKGEYAEVHDFVSRYKTVYDNGKRIFSQLHEATIDITNQYTNRNVDSRHWEQWLMDTFLDPALDGLNRYFALVRITFLYYNYRDFHKLVKIYDLLDQLMQEGWFYSRRILQNYYANRVMVHSKLGDLDRATFYGYLSIRERNADFLHYLNRLAGILLRQEKYEEAIQLMQQSLKELKHTDNFHERVNFAALYVRGLNQTDRAEEGQKYAESFLRGYKEHIFAQRWHMFFLAYLQSLLMQEKYSILLQQIKQYGLVLKERKLLEQGHGIPAIASYQSVSKYKEARIARDKLMNELWAVSKFINHDEHVRRIWSNLLQDLKPHVPEIVRTLSMKDPSDMLIT